MMNTQTGRRPRTQWWRNRVIVTLALAGLLAAGNIAVMPTNSASAADYPSWDDVKNARYNVNQKKVEIDRITALLRQLDEQVKATQAEAIEKGILFQKAQDAFDLQDIKTNQLQEQADEAQAKADDSIKRAGQLAARMSRNGGTDLTSTLWFNGDDARNVLADVGMASKITGQSKGLYDRAIQDQNTAQSLTDQALVAKAELERLRDEAEKARAEAQAAADAAAAALEEQQANDARLRAQLATLETGLIQTEAAYQKGYEERVAAQLAAQVAASGWARPVYGYITSNFGRRVSPCGGCSSFHMGTDIGAPQGTSIFAASGGTVTYAGWSGGYGNLVEISHGDGITTRYGHQMYGGIQVSYGQSVAPGQLIGKVGSTGDSTGNHLHFEVRRYGSAIDPVPFMRDRGISLG